MLQVFKHANASQPMSPGNYLKLSNDFLLALFQRPHTDSCLAPSSLPIRPANSSQINLPQLQCPQISKTTCLAWFPFLNRGPQRVDLQAEGQRDYSVHFICLLSLSSYTTCHPTSRSSFFSCILFSFLLFFFYGGKANTLPVIPSPRH